jgi:hypothetical protein
MDVYRNHSQAFCISILPLYSTGNSPDQPEADGPAEKPFERTKEDTILSIDNRVYAYYHCSLRLHTLPRQAPELNKLNAGKPSIHQLSQFSPTINNSGICSLSNTPKGLMSAWKYSSPQPFSK